MIIYGLISTNGGKPTYFGRVQTHIKTRDATEDMAAKMLLYVYAAPLNKTSQTDVAENGVWSEGNHELQFGGNSYVASEVEFGGQ